MRVKGRRRRSDRWVQRVSIMILEEGRIDDGIIPWDSVISQLGQLGRMMRYKQDPVSCNTL